MKTNPAELLENTIATLNDLPDLRGNNIDSIIKAINIVTTSISEINIYVLSNPFQTETDEIYFFKKIKPEMDGRLIFYLMLLRLRQCTVNSSESVILAKQLNRIDQFYKSESAFYLYYKLNRTDFDDKYFLRKSSAKEFPFDEEHVHFDFNTNTYMSAKAARIIAYELFRAHVENTTLKAGAETSMKKQNRSDSDPIWTASVADFVEFVYSAHEYGLFGKKVKISTLTNFLSNSFGLRVTNIYKTWEDIRLRKKDKTPFMRSMMSSLERRIDHDNEFAP
ncbi:MAG: RteC domain-containing protein [Chitinophagaceae bacterium]|nr:RteC domain-containing protein [Chitinophagaceae bacterium]